eukprot:CAMPEP_0174365308 /NCGR_PEP_ID=MMETSP0811_2-20130205/76752_1 /TAXON_ID=73025 ORGANISM="Eutreptiella gymnastica-like, Strain CCMP1594" /NCGR_SAMPLE_ID=MMETSP0811_2 /ASSEMBLY_ACC=CAM_ASM_000667 /LENGTH=180 /DNA_ID=CAMNT_0015505851 /DNA_START=544 /DNA_END=1083 /DNA_ORIENTATION=-
MAVDGEAERRNSGGGALVHALVRPTEDVFRLFLFHMLCKAVTNGSFEIVPLFQRDWPHCDGANNPQQPSITLHVASVTWTGFTSEDGALALRLWAQTLAKMPVIGRLTRLANFCKSKVRLPTHVALLLGTRFGSLVSYNGCVLFSETGLQYRATEGLQSQETGLPREVYLSPSYKPTKLA